MTFSSSKHKHEAGKSTVVKCLHLVLSNKFINTSPYFYFKYKFFKTIVYINQELSFLLKDKQKKRRTMTMNQGYHQAKLAVLILAIRMNLKNENELET